ncbi:hypothetical protein R1flu_017203 [Riccia fluitans]|uniref:Uncharacterized protein n=1 Tax=Riccia fluitans TaxID=41844 RepID=A0ABD1XGX5_9MARC
MHGQHYGIHGEPFPSFNNALPPIGGIADDEDYVLGMRHATVLSVLSLELLSSIHHRPSVVALYVSGTERIADRDVAGPSFDGAVAVAMSDGSANYACRIGSFGFGHLQIKFASPVSLAPPQACAIASSSSTGSCEARLASSCVARRIALSRLPCIQFLYLV